MNVAQAIRYLEKQVGNSSKGLPIEIFYFISRLTPMVNVDLLIKDEQGRTLLSWRDGRYTGAGWHIPGGIIRFKEKWETRIQQVAITEIGTRVKFDPHPIAINQIVGSQETRGHFISILFRCYLPKKFILNNRGLTDKDQGFLKWHKLCPKNMIKVHDVYRKFI